VGIQLQIIAKKYKQISAFWNTCIYTL